MELVRQEKQTSEFLKLFGENPRFLSPGNGRKRRRPSGELFRIEVIDQVDCDTIREIDFSRLNSNPRR